MLINSIKSLYGPPKVGGDTLSFCTRCKMELAHVIVSMIDARPARVMCKTCKSVHNFRRIGDIGSAKRSSSAAKPAKRYTTASAVRVSEIWEQKMAEKQLAPIKPYQISAIYLKGDVIQHSKFGVGLIEEVRGTKVIVLFRDAEKTLVHATGTPSET